MSQPAFWLKISNKYVIENFEQLLKYVKAYDYDSSQDSEEGDFMQTYRHLKSVADDLAAQVRKLSLYDTPQFDIPINKVIRILGVAILTGRKTGYDDFDLLAALINLLVLNNPNLGADIERCYVDIVAGCVRHCKIESFTLSWADFDEEEFMLGLLEKKLADTRLGTPSDDIDFVFENRGCLTVNGAGITLSNVSRDDNRRKKLKSEIHTDLGLEVMTTSPANATTIEEMLDLYPRISGDFDAMKPRVKPALKTFSDGDKTVVRVRRVSGIKVEVETVDPGYENEEGNVAIEPSYNLVPREYLLNILRPGDYLRVIYCDSNWLPFRFDKEWVSEYLEDLTGEIGEESLRAIYDMDINGGTRWLTDEGFFVNVFDNEVEAAGLSGEMDRAIEDGITCLVNYHSHFRDAKGNFIVKARFEGDTVNTDDPALFRSNAFTRFYRGYLDYVRTYGVPENPDAGVGEIELPMVHLLGILVYRLALKIGRGDSLSRIQHLTAAMLLANMTDFDGEAAFIRAQLDYQRAVILFAKGESPAALPRLADLPESCAGKLTTERSVLDIIHGYREITDGGSRLSVPLLTAANFAGTTSIVRDLVMASNSLLNRIDISEINRIKKTICLHLNVGDQYSDIYNEFTNYGVESDFLEFKASCVLPPESQQTTSLQRDIDYQQWTILKTVCAFLNSMNGGELLIGVSDAGFAIGLDSDIEKLYGCRIISEPNSDRLRTYVKLFVDRGFTTVDGRVSGSAITAERVQYILEKNDENREIMRIKVSPYPWDVVKITAPNRPNNFREAYIRTSGASTPLDAAGIREVKMRKIKAIDKNHYKTARILQAIDEGVVLKIRNYKGANGSTDRSVEPYKMCDDNKSFLAYDLARKDMRRFKLSRFSDGDLEITGEKCKNQKKHADRRLDIFGMVESSTFPAERVHVKLTDYACSLLLEECAIPTEEGTSPLSRNSDYLDSGRYPWRLDVDVFGFAGVARFVMGLPAHTRIVDSPRLEDYIANLRLN